MSLIVLWELICMLGVHNCSIGDQGRSPVIFAISSGTHANYLNTILLFDELQFQR